MTTTDETTPRPNTFLADYQRLTAEGDCSPDEEEEWFVLCEEAAHKLASLLKPCYDCGAPVEAVDLHAYGQGKPESYCRVCYIRNAFQSDDRISATFDGEPYEIVAVPEIGSHPRANLDLLVAYVPLADSLQTRIAQYEQVQAEAGSESGWYTPVLAQLRAELHAVRDRIDDLYDAGFDG